MLIRSGALAEKIILTRKPRVGFILLTQLQLADSPGGYEPGNEYPRISKQQFPKTKKAAAYLPDSLFNQINP
jgi:hypothetical protein